MPVPPAGLKIARPRPDHRIDRRVDPQSEGSGGIDPSP